MIAIFVISDRRSCRLGWGNETQQYFI